MSSSHIFFIPAALLAFGLTWRPGFAGHADKVHVLDAHHRDEVDAV